MMLWFYVCLKVGLGDNVGGLTAESSDGPNISKLFLALTQFIGNIFMSNKILGFSEFNLS